MKHLLPLLFLIPWCAFAQSSENTNAQIASQKTEFATGPISLFSALPAQDPTRTQYESQGLIDAQFFDFAGGAALLGRAAGPITLALPGVNRGADLLLDLEEVDVTSHDFVINVPMPAVRFYRGTIRGASKSMVAITVFEDEVVGIVSQDGYTRSLGRVKDGGGIHVLYSENRQDWAQPLTCGTEDDNMLAPESDVREGASADRAPGDCVRLYIEIDESLTNDLGGVSAATNYALGVFNAQQTLYANDGIGILLSELKIWTDSDPAPYTLNGFATLDSYMAESGAFNGDLAYLAFRTGFLGGIAWVGGICQPDPDFSKGVGGHQGFYQNLPTYTWDVSLISHEVGHLFNAPHTHACVWNGNNTAIDGCAGETQGDCPVPSFAPFAGTIMSYCAQNDFTEGFHPQVAAHILEYIASRTCTEPCVTPTCDDGIQNGLETGVDCGGPNCAPCPCDGNALSLSINFDNYPQETTWQILDEDGAQVAAGGPYGSQPDGSTISLEICLPDGCYTFEILDSANDGLCCQFGEGSYTLNGPDGTIASGADFGSSESTDFCVGDLVLPTCDDGIQNGEETGVDCGGPDCAPCQAEDCEFEETYFANFELGYAIWNDGGGDCRINSVDAPFASSGVRCLRLRDNSPSSQTYTNILGLASNEAIRIAFGYYAASMEEGEDFWLQISYDGGDNYSTLRSYVSGQDFENDIFYSDEIEVAGPFNSEMRLRFVCDASSNADRIYLDDVRIDVCREDASTQQMIWEPYGTSMAEEKVIRPGQSLETILYPNPTQGVLQVEFEMDEKQAMSCMVIDMQGRPILQENYNAQAGPNRMTLDLSDLSVGTYFFVLRSSTGHSTQRFMIQR